MEVFSMVHSVIRFAFLLFLGSPIHGVCPHDAKVLMAQEKFAKIVPSSRAKVSSQKNYTKKDENLRFWTASFGIASLGTLYSFYKGCRGSFLGVPLAIGTGFKYYASHVRRYPLQVTGSFRPDEIPDLIGNGILGSMAFGFGMALLSSCMR